MSQQLPNGVKLPAIGDTDWGTDMNDNLTLLDNTMGRLSSYAKKTETYTKTDIDNKLKDYVSTTETNEQSVSSDLKVENISPNTDNQSSLGSTQKAFVNVYANDVSVKKSTGGFNSVKSHLENTNIHCTQTEKQTWNDKQDEIVGAEKDALQSGITSAKVTSYDNHIADTSIHVTANEKQTWNGKQNALTTTQLNAVNSGITATLKGNYDSHLNNQNIHVTTSDKTNWNSKQTALTTEQLKAVNSGITAEKVLAYDEFETSKADDSDVVHNTGNEEIDGIKTFVKEVVAPTFKGALEDDEKITSLGTDYYNVVSVNAKRGMLYGKADSTGNGFCLTSFNDERTSSSKLEVGSKDSDHYITWNGLVKNNIIPQKGNYYSLGSSSIVWKDLYVTSINGKTPAYRTDIPDVSNFATKQEIPDISNLAIDSSVVHKSGNETIGGIKTFTSSMTIDGNGNEYQAYATDYVKGIAPSAIIYQGLRFYDDQKVSTVGNHITGAFEIQYGTDGYNKAYIGCRNYAGTTQHNYSVGLRIPNDLTRSMDFLPSADNKINLGSTDYKWADVNTYLINGKTPAYTSDLDAKANDVDVVHTKGSEEIGGTKTFTGTIVHRDSTQKLKMVNTYIDYDVPLTANRTSSIEFYDKNNKDMARLILQRESSGRNSFGIITYNRSDSNEELSRKVSLYLDKDNNSYFSPNTNNQIDLGSSSYHWKNLYVNSINSEEVVTPTYLNTKAETWEFTLEDGSTITKKIVCM